MCSRKKARTLGAFGVRYIVGNTVILGALAELPLDHVRVELLVVRPLDQLSVGAARQNRNEVKQICSKSFK